MADAQGISQGTKTLAFAMRRFPLSIRKTWWWWEQLYRKIGGGGFDDDPETDARWPGGLQAPIVTRPYGFKVRLDLRLWPERRTYFSGSYYQTSLEYLYRAVLRPGDQYLDIGANIGMTSLMAASLIGDRGKGFAFEPNPETFDRLRINFDLNPYRNIELVPCAVADVESEAVLSLPAEGNTGIGSLAGSPEEGGRSFKVRTVPGQRYLDQLDRSRPTFVKVDVEGFEVKVLSGIRSALDWPEIGLVLEVNESMLQRAGDSVAAMDELVKAHGFEVYGMDMHQTRFDRTLTIDGPVELADPSTRRWADVLLLKPGTTFRERLAPLIRPAAGRTA
ncbi:FkbM family methyltransferase [Paludisphaera mucosa]|uniref:FkbM family methyltransferase n=1 Tax=Paludisphaera mucosa TaxID=3030827 RepID=A0ABT6FK07_9BACT|nr:FkbM family methyltransferase [Paludisphaera mucosa]MDG3007913.1 FkbM family methyltransferase [Paludisphaera mucosa]